MQKIVILKVSENMADATIGPWHINEGDPVSKGNLVVDLITEKATFEIEAEQDGILLKQYAKTKSIVPVGFTVALIGTDSDLIPGEIEQKNTELMQNPEISITRDASPLKPSSGNRIKATPAARRKAKKAGVDLAAVKNSIDTDRVITEKDVDDFLNL